MYTLLKFNFAILNSQSLGSDSLEIKAKYYTKVYHSMDMEVSIYKENFKYLPKKGMYVSRDNGKH